MKAEDKESKNGPIDFSSINVTTAPSVVYSNTDQEVIVITRDKLNLCLQGAMERMSIRDQWMIPLGILVSLILTVATASFSERFGIGGGEWETVFVMLTLFATIWLIYALYRRPKSASPDSIVDELAKNPVSLSGSLKATVVEPVQPSSSTKGSMSGLDQILDQLIKAAPAKSDSSRRERRVMSLNPGEHVTHDAYGPGTVLEVRGTPDEPEAVIDFGDDYGRKHLVLRYAPLEKTKQG